MKAIFAVMNTTSSVRQCSLLKQRSLYQCSLAQLIEHCTGIAEVMGSNPVQAWIFFQALFSLPLKQCSLLRRSLSYSRLYPQFKYMTFIYSQSFIDDYISKKPSKFGVTVTLKPAIKMFSEKIEFELSSVIQEDCSPRQVFFNHCRF